METLFEFYARTMFKETFDSERYTLDKYSRKWFMTRASGTEEIERGVHLMSYCIPDIVVRDRLSNEAVAVIDAKYKAHDRSVRTDSFQLLSYVLLSGVSKCGFVFPGAETRIKQMRTSGAEYLPIQTPLMNDLKYYEIILGSTLNEAILEQLLPGNI